MPPVSKIALFSWLVVSLLFGFLPNLLTGEEPNILPGHIPPLPLSQDQEQTVWTALLEEKLLSRPEVLPPHTIDQALITAWAGNTSYAKARIERIEVILEGEGKESGSKHEFIVSVEFQNKYVIVSSSIPSNSELLGGLRFQIQEEKQRRVFLDGKLETGISIHVPKMSLGEEGRWAVIFCPREEGTTEIEGKKEQGLLKTSYQVKKVRFVPSAEVNAHALTGVDIGVARASILTTSSVPKANNYFDESYGKDPKVKISYAPFEAETDASDFKDKLGGGAIASHFELHRRVGFRREVTFRDSVWVKEVQLQGENSLFVPLEGGEILPVFPGRCYFVIKERVKEEVFSKKDFALPERLRGLAANLPKRYSNHLKSLETSSGYNQPTPP